MNKLEENIQLRLKDFSPATNDDFDLVYDKKNKQYPIDRNIFPVPNLLLFLLIKICKFTPKSRGEKMHWNIAFTYKKNNYAITYEKFGLKLYTENHIDIRPKEVLGKLKKILDIIERHELSDLSKHQILKGNITLINQFPKLDNQYAYFRDRALFEYSSEEKNEALKENIDHSDFMKNLISQINDSWGALRAGQYNALAMIDAYFSRLEHLLVLALPFSNYNREKDSLAEFVGSIWSDKLRRILDFSDIKTQQHYNALINIKEKFRNTFAHGGFEKNGQSFYFHLDKIGAIPASMSSVKDSVHFNFFPIDKIGFERICSVFDEFDKYLSLITLPKVWKLADSGLNLALDENSLSELLEASNESEVYEQWIERNCHWRDQIDNADY